MKKRLSRTDAVVTKECFCCSISVVISWQEAASNFGLTVFSKRSGEIRKNQAIFVSFNHSNASRTACSNRISDKVWKITPR
jgi:hypothetical protein